MTLAQIFEATNFPPPPPIFSRPPTLSLMHTKQADLTNRACYLESSNGINPLIYAKLGFAIKRKIHLARGERPVELDIMVREPSCAGKNEQRVGVTVGETAMAMVRERVGAFPTGTPTAVAAALIGN